jgi:hypothetical protein
VFTERVEAPDIKSSCGWEKTVNKAFRQALKLQAVLLVARTHKKSARTFWRSQSAPTGRRDTSKSRCLSCGEPGHFWGSCLYRREAENADWGQTCDERPPRDK